MSHACVLEEDVGAAGASRLEVDEGAQIRRPLGARHEAVCGREHHLLAAVQQEEHGRGQIKLWVGNDHARQLQRGAHARRAVGRAWQAGKEGPPLNVLTEIGVHQGKETGRAFSWARSFKSSILRLGTHGRAGLVHMEPCLAQQPWPSKGGSPLSC